MKRGLDDGAEWRDLFHSIIELYCESHVAILSSYRLVPQHCWPSLSALHHLHDALVVTLQETHARYIANSIYITDRYQRAGSEPLRVSSQRSVSCAFSIELDCARDDADMH